MSQPSHDTEEARASRMEVMVTALFDGHNLSGWEMFTDTEELRGYQVTCLVCGRTAAVWENGLIYSLLSGCEPTD